MSGLKNVHCNRAGGYLAKASESVAAEESHYRIEHQAITELCVSDVVGKGEENHRDSEERKDMETGAKHPQAKETEE
jgi:hypothetical protein